MATTIFAKVNGKVGSLWLVFLIVFNTYDLFGQSVIRGSVVEKHTANPVAFVNVLVKNPSSQHALNFSVTDEKGFFTITIEEPKLDSVLVQFRAMTIQDTVIRILNVSQELRIEVASEVQELEEFSIRSPKNPITFKNDTLSYDVESFASGNDRVLSDVLKKLPGIEVDADGRIQYDGKAIQNFYIDGLNLLEGRYNLASNNLPIDALESIQVLENHQPIKALDSLIFSDKTSLNIKLKRKNVWLGVASVGVGASPFLYQGKLTAMMFGPTFQMINVAEGNNTGQNLSVQTESLSLEDLKNLSLKMNVDPWAEVPRLQPGPISKERYVFNDSKLLSSNALFKTKKNLEVRLIASLVEDINVESSIAESSFFLPSDTVTIAEVVDNRFKISRLETEVTLAKNEKDQYFKNAIRLKANRLEDSGLVNFNLREINQRGIMPLLQLENQLQSLIAIGGSFVDVNSFIGFVSKNQDFSLYPNVFAAEGSSGGLIAQNVSNQAIKSVNSVGLVRRLSQSWTFNTRLGFQFQSDRMLSEINQDLSSGGVDFGNTTNDLSRVEISPFVQNQLLFRSKYFRITIDAPIHYTTIKTTGIYNSGKAGVSKVIAQPSVLVNYQISGKLSARLSANRYTNFQGLEQHYAGLILRNYRIFTLRNTSIPESITTKVAGTFSYKDPISSVFSTLSYSFGHDQRNTIAQNQIFDGGFNVFSMVDQMNFRKTHSWNFRLSKHFLELKSVATFSTLLLHNTFQQLLNSSLVDFSQVTLSPKIDLSISPTRVVGLRNTTSMSSIQTSSSENVIPALLLLQSLTNLEFYPVSNHSLVVRWEYFENRNIGNPNSSLQNNFLDLVYLYKWEEKKLDFKLELLNILNNNTYDTYSLDTFMLISQSILLRPRQAVLQVNFRF